MSVVEVESFLAHDLRLAQRTKTTGFGCENVGHCVFEYYDTIHQVHISWTCSIEENGSNDRGRESVQRSAVRCYLVWDAHQAGVRRVDRRMYRRHWDR